MRVVIGSIMAIISVIALIGTIKPLVQFMKSSGIAHEVAKAELSAQIGFFVVTAIVSMLLLWRGPRKK